MPAPPPDTPCRQVFYVEDDATNVLLMQGLFRHRPALRLTVAMSGREAFEVADGLVAPPALLLLDLRLPDCHGSALLPLLKGRPGWGDLPAIAVTAEPAFDWRACGFDALWPKPLDLRQVLDWLDRALEPPPAAGGRRGGTAGAGGAARQSWTLPLGWMGS